MLSLRRHFRRHNFGFALGRLRLWCKSPFPAIRRQGRERHSDIAASDFRLCLHLRHTGEVIAYSLHQLQPKFLMCHFPAPKLELPPNFVASIKEVFAVTDFRQVIVIVDVNAKFNFLQLRAGGSFVLLVFGNVVAKFPECDDFANWRVCHRRNFDQIETETLSFAQSVRQFHDAELFAGGTQNNPDFAGANPTVYTKLLLQIKPSSLSAKRECTAASYFFCRIFQRSLAAVRRNTLAWPQLR